MKRCIFLGLIVFLALVFPAFAATCDWSEMEKRFKEPPLASKSRPLWFWNEVPNETQTREIMESCKESGYAGLAILPAFAQEKMKFMSPEFLQQYKFAADTAQELGLKLCLYDEFWFPSGSAGGLLKEQHPEHLCKRLDMLQETVDSDNEITIKIPEGTLMGCVAMNTKTFARTNITESVTENVLRWKRPEGDKDSYKIMAFVCVLDGQRNLVDYLEPESVGVFIKLTYAEYQKAMPEHFGTTIDSAFYDEPMLYTPGDGRAWTPKFNEYFQKRFEYDPVPLYPAMFMDIGPETASARNALFGFRATLFSEGFVKTIADWLKPYNMPLTGHLDQEEVVNPVGVSGDAIKFFQYQQIPGLDEVFQYGRGSCMYKLISSAAANYDRHLVMTEVYGAISNMPVDVLYKEAMDQAAKGVNMFVPHAVWYDISPEKIVFQPELSSRHEIYGPALPKYNEYIGRLHTILQSPGGTMADVAVLYPIESLQATYHFGGPIAAYVGGVRSDQDNYMKIGERLSLKARRDFIYLHPETLLERCEIVAKNEKPVLELKNTDNPAAFSTLVVPAMKCIGLKTLEKIAAFQKAGGTVVAVGRLPDCATKKEDDAAVTKLLQEIFGNDIPEKAKEVSKGVVVTASSSWTAGGYEPVFAFDGSAETRWNAADGSGNGQWLQIDFEKPVPVLQVMMRESFDRVEKFTVQYKDEKGAWTEAAKGEKIGREKLLLVAKGGKPIKSDSFRFVFDQINSASVSISEISLLSPGRKHVLAPSDPTLFVHKSDSGNKAYYIAENPFHPEEQRVKLLEEALGSGTVSFRDAATIPPGLPTGSVQYLHRKIGGRDVFFFSNSTQKQVDTTICVRVDKAGDFSWWNPHDGSIQPASGQSGENNETQYHLVLPPVRSVFLIAN